MLDDKYLIYGLVDPITQELRYIGRSSSGFERAKTHWMPSLLKKDKTYCTSWVKSILKNNLVPEIITIEVFSDDILLNESEIFWISYFKSIGCRLTNLTNGGFGHWGYKQTEEHKNNFKKSINKTLLENPDLKQKYIAQLEKNKNDPVVIKKHKEKMSLYWSDVNNREKMSEIAKERCKDPIVRNQLKNANKIGVAKLKKAVIEITTNLSFESQTEAAKYFNINQREISAVVTGRRKTTHGKIFRYLKKYDGKR